MSVRVLVLDRGSLRADGVAPLLRFMGHQVRSVTCAETVLDEALDFRPDLALVDWTMPDAAPICRNLALSGTRIVAVGGAGDANRADAADIDVFIFLSTPCDRPKLSELLATAQEDDFDRREKEKVDDRSLIVGEALIRRHWAYLARVLVFRLHGGTRDGQELFGNRAVELYVALGEKPLHRTFLACRRHLIFTNTSLEEVVKRDRYIVESVAESQDRILINAHSIGMCD